MKALRVMIVVLASVHLGWTALTALVANFADGGSVPERLLLSVVHPVAALLLVYVVAFSEQLGSWPWRITMMMLPISIGADILTALLIGQGVLRGDWSLPLTFAVVPAIGLVYIIWRRNAQPIGAT